MRLFKSIFFKANERVVAAPYGEPPRPRSRPAPDNVVDFLPHINPHFAASGLSAAPDSAQADTTPGRASTGRAGLLDAPQLLQFFKDDHLAQGTHDGATYRSREALEQGRHGLIAGFQKLLESLVERRIAEHFRLQDSLLETEGLDRGVERRLQLACERVEREIGVLRSEILAAADGKGWVLEALNQYQIGFLRGVKTAVEFQLMASVAEEAL